MGVATGVAATGLSRMDRLFYGFFNRILTYGVEKRPITDKWKEKKEEKSGGYLFSSRQIGNILPTFLRWTNREEDAL